MKDKKRRFEFFNIIDSSNTQRHLEKMARQGWLIEGVSSFGWTYRKIEPKKLKFSITYYPKASAFDPHPSEDQQTLIDFCRRTGWILACTVGQAQIFYNENPNPIPIETDPAIELENIHASAKRSLIPSNVAIMAILMLNVWTNYRLYRTNPLQSLASHDIFIILFILLLGVFSVVKSLADYFSWYKRAKESIDSDRLPPMKDTTVYNKITLAIIGVVFAAYLVPKLVSFDGVSIRAVVGMLIYTVAILTVLPAIQKQLKKENASKNTNRIITIGFGIVLSVSMIVMVVMFIIAASSQGMLTGEETYTYNGAVFTLYNDDMPITLEDFGIQATENYTKQNEHQSSVLLEYSECRQSPRFDRKNYRNLPHLEYILVKVKADFLYDFCLKTIIDDRQDILPGEGEEYRRMYQTTDPTPWGANGALQLMASTDSFTGWYLLCYDDYILEIRCDVAFDSGAMAAIGQKLAG